MKKKKAKVVSCKECKYYDENSVRICNAPTDYCIKGLIRNERIK